MIWRPSIPDFPFDETRVWKVVASAGCGKSFQIKRAILDLIEKRGVAPNKIMYLIYNKIPADAFVDEMRLHGIDDDGTRWMGTHHGICFKMLGLSRTNALTGKILNEWGKNHGYDFKDDPKNEDEKTEAKKILESLSLKIYNNDEKFDPLERRMYEKFLEEERGTGRYTFIRMLQSILRQRRVPLGIEYVFVDEAQDNGKIQFEYFEYLKTLPQIKGIMLVGDDKQAINHYKGGRWDLYMDFPADVSVCLGKTWRNAKKILEFANNIARPIRERSPLTEETAVEAPGAVVYRREIEDVLPDIESAIHAKKSVLLLSRNRVFKNKAIGILSNYGLPVRSQKIDNILRVVRSMRAMERVTLDAVSAILPGEDPSPGELKKTSYWKRGGLAAFKKHDYEDDDDVDLKIEYAALMFGEWESDLTIFGFSPKFMDDVRGAKENRIPLDAFMGTSNDEIRAIQRNVDRYGLDMGFVFPSVIHPIKGEEADTVVLLRNITRAPQETERCNPDEERRVWYVAATRARTKLIVTELYERSGYFTSIV